MRPPAVVSACGDPGGAAALAPVLEQLRLESRVALAPYAYRHGFDLLMARGLAPAPIPEQPDPGWFDGVLKEQEAAVVLTATSHNGYDHEKAFITAARRAGIPSMAVLDFWTNYRARFSDAAGCLIHVPDLIAAMDQSAREGLMAEGLPPESIVVTGHPAFDALSSRRAQFTETDRAAVRRALGAEAGDLLVIFASQPLRELYGSPGSPSYLGYDEHSVLDSVIEALEAAAERLQSAVTLVIRPHPRETTDAHARRRSRTIRIAVTGDGDPRTCAMAADLVIGMTSVLLVEAGYLGCAVVSLQPGRLGGDLLPPDAHERISVVSRREDVATVLERLAVDPSVRESARNRADGMRLPGLAVPRVVEQVYSLIPRSRSGREVLA